MPSPHADLGHDVSAAVAGGDQPVPLQHREHRWCSYVAAGCGGEITHGVAVRFVVVPGPRIHPLPGRRRASSQPDVAHGDQQAYVRGLEVVEGGGQQEGLVEPGVVPQPVGQHPAERLHFGRRRGRVG